jgi:hypothetical protein
VRSSRARRMAARQAFDNGFRSDDSDRLAIKGRRSAFVP